MVQHLADTDMGEPEEIIFKRDEIFLVESSFQFFFENVFVGVETFKLRNLFVPQRNLATTLIIPRGIIDGWIRGGWTCLQC